MELTRADTVGNDRYLRTPAIAGASSDDENPPLPKHSSPRWSGLFLQAVGQLFQPPTARKGRC
jgi:hypothetical protein